MIRGQDLRLPLRMRDTCFARTPTGFTPFMRTSYRITSVINNGIARHFQTYVLERSASGSQFIIGG